MRRFSLAALVVGLSALPMLMAPVGGPTTRTPRLTVGTTGAVAASGNLRVNGSATVVGALFAESTLTVTGATTMGALTVSSCTGCSGAQTTDTVSLTFSEGCSNTPEIFLTWTVTGNVITVQFADDAASTDCISDAGNFGTPANELPLVPFGDIAEQRRVKYTTLSIGGSPIDMCAVFETNRSVAFFTGISCNGTVGNTTKVVTTNTQNPLTFLMGS